MWMVLHVEEDRVVKCVLWFFDWALILPGFLDCCVEMREEGVFVISSCSEVFIKGFESDVFVVVISAQGVDSVDDTMNHSCKQTGRVARVWWNIEVEIVRFFVECSFDFTFVDRNSEIHEIDFRFHSADFPFESEFFIVEVRLELFPLLPAFGGVIPEPDSNEVVDESLKEGKVFFIFFL